jgi:hypothetical protein
MSRYGEPVVGNSSDEPPSVYGRGLPPKEEVKDANFTHQMVFQVYKRSIKMATASTL